MDRQSSSNSKYTALKRTLSRRLTARQRRVLLLLGLVNLFLFLLLGLLLVGNSDNQGQVSLPSPTVAELLSLDRRNLCRDQASQAVLEAGLVGTVYVGQHGVLSVRIVRHSGFGCDADACSQSVSALAFDGVWIVFQALGRVADAGCSDLDRLHVVVIVRTTGQASFEAQGQVRLSDLARWADGGIDDGELADRLTFQTAIVP